MLFQWVILTTDALLYLLLISVLIFIFWVRRHEQWLLPWQQVGRNKLAMVACCVLILFSVIAVLDSIHFRPAVAQGNHQQRYYSAHVVSVLDQILTPIGQQYEQTYSAPMATHSFVKSNITFPNGEQNRIYPPLTHYHILGTDKVGADVFYQSLKSVRTGIIIGTVTTLVMLPFALLLGMMAGFFGGWIDDIIQYLYTTLSSIPGVLLISASVISIQVYISNHPMTFQTIAERADIRLLALCVILGVTSWTSLCRLLRAETLKIREMDYVRAATALGVTRFKIILRYIFPNVLHIVLITIVLDFSSLVLAEAVLSYVGVGVDPTSFSWGNMINSARLDLAREPAVWWPLFSAFLFMFTLVLAANLFSDAVRDAFDPRLRDAH